MKIPFYQTHWFDLSLKDIASNIGHAFNTVADQAIYDRIYQAILTQEKPFSEEWRIKKLTLAKWLNKFFIERNFQNAKILSVGCGFGIVEQSLIQQGLKIDLQECQNKSLLYFNRKYPEESQKTKQWISQTLTDIPEQSYDVVMAITSTYGLDEKTLSSFFGRLSQIIKPGGICIFYETVLTLADLKYYLVNRLRRRLPEGILWGWKRSPKVFLNFARASGLRVREKHFFDSHNREIKPKVWLNSCFSNETAWQMLILENR